MAKGDKLRQVVWVPLDLAVDIARFMQENNIAAMNTAIVEIVRRYFERPERVKEIIKEVPKEVVKEVEREVYICPFCYQRQGNLEALKLHIKGLHKEEVRR